MKKAPVGQSNSEPARYGAGRGGSWIRSVVFCIRNASHSHRGIPVPRDAAAHRAAVRHEGSRCHALPRRSLEAAKSHCVTVRCNGRAFDLRLPQARKVVQFARRAESRISAAADHPAAVTKEGNNDRVRNENRSRNRGLYRRAERRVARPGGEVGFLYRTNLSRSPVADG